MFFELLAEIGGDILHNKSIRQKVLWSSHQEVNVTYLKLQTKENANISNVSVVIYCGHIFHF